MRANRRNNWLAVARLIAVCVGLVAGTASAAAQVFVFSNTNADGSISGSFPSFTLTGGNNGSGSAGFTTYAATFSVDTRVAYNWSYSTSDSDGAGFDHGGFVLNGVFTQLTANGGNTQLGSATILVRAGQSFGWSVNTTDNRFGPATFTISATATPVPVITSITPTSGSSSGGTVVAITGTGLTGATAVTFGTTNATSFTVNSPTQITAIAPAGANTVDITVTNPAGTSAISAADRFTYIAPTSNLTISSSRNPSSAGQAVTFTATVAGAGGTPTGTVAFLDNGSPIGTGTLASGIATFTTSILSVGSHTITASYGGDGAFKPGVSPGLTQTVSVPLDSLRLRELQIDVTKVVAQNSGQAISGAIDSAISDGFSDGGAFFTPSATGMHFNFAADRDNEEQQATSSDAPPGRGNAYVSGNARPGGSSQGGRGRDDSRVDSAFAAIDQSMPRKALKQKFRERTDWLFWVDVRGTGIDRWSAPTTLGTPVSQSSLYGQQVNALMGMTYKVAPNFIVGALGGYEQFNYTEQDVNGKLTGDGWTVGSYLGWKITPFLRYDAALTYSGIGYDGVADSAQGNFNGQRWMVSTGFTGTYQAMALTIEPSAKVYALWEHEDAYTDSLGTLQTARDFATGRASGGVRAIYPWQWNDRILLAPYLGAYGDYYFTADNAAAIALAGGVPLASTPLLDGWSARFTGGVNAKFAGGALLGLGGELGGIGNSYRIWTFSAKARLPLDPS
jgi:Bacterial Ig-like domain (group 3)/Autotransporter beta-domain/IPT/TIG domain